MEKPTKAIPDWIRHKRRQMEPADFVVWRLRNNATWVVRFIRCQLEHLANGVRAGFDKQTATGYICQTLYCPNKAQLISPFVYEIHRLKAETAQTFTDVILMEWQQPDSYVEYSKMVPQVIRTLNTDEKHPLGRIVVRSGFSLCDRVVTRYGR